MMKKIILALACVLALPVFGQYRPNYYSTNSNPAISSPAGSNYVYAMIIANGINPTNGVTAAVATNIAAYQAKLATNAESMLIINAPLSNGLSARLIATNDILAGISTAITNGLSARIIATNDILAGISTAITNGLSARLIATNTILKDISTAITNGLSARLIATNDAIKALIPATNGFVSLVEITNVHNALGGGSGTFDYTALSNTPTLGTIAGRGSNDFYLASNPDDYVTADATNAAALQLIYNGLTKTATNQGAFYIGNNLEGTGDLYLWDDDDSDYARLEVLNGYLTGMKLYAGSLQAGTVMPDRLAVTLAVPTNNTYALTLGGGDEMFWTEMGTGSGGTYDYLELTNAPTLGTAAYSNANAFDATGSSTTVSNGLSARLIATNDVLAGISTAITNGLSARLIATNNAIKALIPATNGFVSLVEITNVHNALGGGTAAGTTNQTFWGNFAITDGTNTLGWTNGVLTLNGPAGTNQIPAANITNLSADTFVLDGTNILDLIGSGGGGTTNNYTNYVSIAPGANITVTTNSPTSFTIAATGGSGTTTSNFFGSVLTASNNTPFTLYSAALATNTLAYLKSDVIGFDTNANAITWSTLFSARNSNGVMYLGDVTVLEHSPETGLLTNCVLLHTNSGQNVILEFTGTNTTLKIQASGEFKTVAMPTMSEPEPDPGEIAFVGTTNLYTADGVSSTSVVITNTAAGFMVAGVTFAGTTTTIVVSDSQDNTWTALTSTNTTWSDNGFARLFYATNTAAGSNLVTATFGDGKAYSVLAVAHYTGVQLAAPLDSFSIRPGDLVAGYLISSDEFTTTESGDLILAFTQVEDGTYTPANGLNLRSDFFFDGIQSSAGATNMFATNSVTEADYICVGMGLKAQ